MKENNREEEFLAKVRDRLDAGLEQLDPAISGRLRESRKLAVDLAEMKPFSLFSMPRLIPLGGFATLAVAAVAVSLWFAMRPQPFPNKAAEDMEVLTVQGNLDMYKDLEFYQMLAQTNEVR